MKKLLLPLSVLALILIAGGTTYALNVNSSSKSAENQSPSTTPRPTDQKSTDFVGTVGCYTHKDGGAHTLECALVLTQDDGKVYDLSSQDPKVLSSLSGGQRVRVTGTLSSQSAHKDVEGTINVEVAERL